VVGFEMLVLIDEFSGYNQVLVLDENRLKTTFKTKRRTYAYKRIPFGSMNASATFENAMGITIKGLINKSVVIYMGGIMIFYKKHFDHLHHLKKIFERCGKYGISLNPKICVFGVIEGNLLGHIILKEGI
jgi:hypothetical protein